MEKEESDKLKNLFEEIKEVQKKIDKLQIKGELKEIKACGNSAHISIEKNLIGRKAFVIVIPDWENI
ncbi:MAG: DUF2080 family transposase-associated protein [Candidatus Woesearchaeota archaeon]